jgi:transposase-like protein
MSGARRKFSSAFKAKVANEAIKEQCTNSELDKESEVQPNQVSQWKREFLDRSALVFKGDQTINGGNSAPRARTKGGTQAHWPPDHRERVL